jgi:hypothetical protein
MTTPAQEAQIAEFARKLFEEKRCPGFLLLWGKVLGCGEGADHGGDHRYNQAVSSPASLS